MPKSAANGRRFRANRPEPAPEVNVKKKTTPKKKN